MTGGFCTECGKTVDSFDGLQACPHCGTTSIPCLQSDQVDVSVNWHELRILVMWAENWQRKNGLGRTVYAIAQRIATQHPGRQPLTFAGEIGEVAKRYDVSVTDPSLRHDIAAQTGEEVGLVINLPKDGEPA